jgi:hypothetical protein
MIAQSPKRAERLRGRGEHHHPVLERAAHAGAASRSRSARSVSQDTARVRGRNHMFVDDVLKIEV